MTCEAIASLGNILSTLDPTGRWGYGFPAMPLSDYAHAHGFRP
jgi:hypothetical protein